MINKTYINLLHEIMDQGYLYEDPNRRGVYRRQLNSYLIEHNLLKDGFPFITVKETYPNLAFKELQLFTSGETDIRKYWAIGVNFWDHDWKRYYKIDQNTPKEELQNLPEHMYNLPGIYPELLTKWGHKDINQVSNLLNTLNDNPMATKKTVTMWNPGIEGVLSPCHHMFQVMVQPLTNICRVQEAIRRGVGDKGYLNKALYDGECRKASVSLGESVPKYYISLKFHMGSSDVFLGLPMNINYYAGLLIWLGQKTGMVPYKIYGDLSNAHLYDNSWKATEDLLEQPLRHSKVEMEYQGKEEEKGLQYPIWSSFKWNKDEVKMGKKYNVPMLTYNK